MSSYEKDDLASFEQHMSSLPLTNHSIMKRRSKDQLASALLTKESEVAALKEVIDKWRSRALEAESLQTYYSEQLEMMQAQYENEIAVIEEEYMDQLNEKDDIIFGLRQESHYFAGKVSQNDDPEDIEEFDTMSLYDREQSYPSSIQSSIHQRTKSEDILDSIQHTFHAIEQELRNHSSTLPNRHRRSLSASTLIEPPLEEGCHKKKLSLYNAFKVFPKMLKKQARHSWGKKQPHPDPLTAALPLVMSNTPNTRSIPA
ncbi:hypothetical protein BY458DRAFT_513685 [Sporodiniella umbellata]|nr:hypothetical protein BY458DRAFT_513685 [Sporodiniella umbellata]